MKQFFDRREMDIGIKVAKPLEVKKWNTFSKALNPVDLKLNMKSDEEDIDVEIENMEFDF